MRQTSSYGHCLLHGLCGLCVLLTSCSDDGGAVGGTARAGGAADGVASDAVVPDGTQTASGHSTEDLATEEPGSSLRGVFVDSPVSGLMHISASGTGVTDAEGRFTYRQDERVEFLLGDSSRPDAGGWSLGKAFGAPVVTPLGLTDSDDLSFPVMNTVRLLQSLDVDRDPSNGVTLPALPADLVNAISAPDFSLAPEQFFADPAVMALLERMTDAGRPVSLDGSLDHFHTSLNDVLPAPSGDWILTEVGSANVVPAGIEASLSFRPDRAFEATVRSGDDRARVVARYELEGQTLTVSPTRIDLRVGGDEVWEAALDGDALAALLSSPAHAAMRLAVGLGARLRHLPNSLELRDADGGVRLTYHRGDPLVHEVVSYAEIAPIDSPTLSIGDTLELRAEAFTSSSSLVADARFRWTSSDESVATVTPDGTVRAVGAGTAVIVASAAGTEVRLRIDVAVPAGEQLPSCSDDSIHQSNRSEIKQSNSDPSVSEPSQTNVESVVQIQENGCDVDTTGAGSG